MACHKFLGRQSFSGKVPLEETVIPHLGASSSLRSCHFSLINLYLLHYIFSFKIVLLKVAVFNLFPFIDC